MFNWFKKKQPSTLTTFVTNRSQQFLDDGDALLARGDLGGAEACYRQAILVDASNAMGRVNLGYLLLQLERNDEALAELKSALTLDGDNPQSHYLIGGLFEKRGEYSDAAMHFKKAFQLNSKFELACRDACRVLVYCGRLSEAHEVISDGLDVSPDFADFHFYQGNLYLAESAFDQALTCYKKALELGADYAAVHGFIGGLLLRRNEEGMARTHLQRAVELDPNHSDAHHDLGVALHRLGMMQQAIEHQRAAIALDPSLLHAHSCLLFALSFAKDIGPTEYLAQARQFGAQARRVVPNAILAAEPHALTVSQRLRVGLVSGDFRWHAVALFLEGVLESLKHQPLDLFAFSNNPSNDAVTHRLRQKVGQWHDIANLSDEVAANLIRGCRIDVLIDLSGHTASNRLPMFAWRPAPVQISWLGYFASTGLVEMDYFLTDPYSTPSESHHDFCEKIWYLPETRLCMTQPLVPTDFPVNPLPALETGFITFGCFQTLAKINDDVLSAWSSILARVPNSRLRIQSRHLAMPDIQTDLSRRLAKAGIDLNRVALHGGGPTPMYFKAHNQIDMILDTFPYPGGTTTAEALWMGVPTLTINGNSLLARQGASMLHNAGLSDWIANDESDYVAKAVNFASDTTALATMRAQLRQQVLGSPLFDGDRFAKHLTTALFAMFKDRAQRLQKHSGQTD